MGPSPWEGAVGEETVLHPGKPLDWPGGQSGQKVSFRDSEERVLTGALAMVAAGGRQTSKEDRCFVAAVRGPRCTHAGTRRGWVLKLGVQDRPRESTGWLHRDSLKGLKCDCRKSLGPPQGKVPLLKGM